MIYLILPLGFAHIPSFIFFYIPTVLLTYVNCIREAIKKFEVPHLQNCGFYRSRNLLPEIRHLNIFGTSGIHHSMLT